jgi:hypothetical protein
MLPRIRGKVGQADDPPEMAGKWFFSLWVSELGAGDVDDSNPDFGPIGPWDTEAQAKRELERAAQIACEAVEEKVTGKKSGEYVDMKTNLTRRWDRANEH